MINQRWLALAVPVAWLFVLASAASVVYVRHQARTLFVELEQLSAERDRLNIEWSQLQLEQSSWSNPGFVEQVANDRLRMTLPKPTEVKIVSQ
ncbi:MAG: cell division protein FtsL [Steroidobacteraceae bacterium]|nr:cell division protein FtsL [Steroidobacteraceae bacterium]MCC7199496.1 cell division protein FtsL [Gammaproteobacteria bacterium]